MRSERKHGLSTEQFPVSAYVGSSKNQKDLTGERQVSDVAAVSEHCCLFPIVGDPLVGWIDPRYSPNTHPYKGYIAYKKPPPPYDHHRPLGIVLM